MNLFKTNWFLLILLSAIWGGAFTLNKIALDIYIPEVIVAGRLIVGSAFLIVLIYFIYKRFSFNLSQLNYYLFMSLVGIVIPFIAIINGQRNIDSAMAGILMATMPITTILLSHFFLVDEKINQQKFIGFLISFFGVFILIYREDLFINNSFSKTLISQLQVMLGSTLYSIAAIYGKKYKMTDPVSASTGTILFATFFMLIYLIFIDESNVSIPMLLVNYNILLLGILCTAIATIIYFQILQTAGASFLSIMNFLIPLWAILFGILILNDDFSWNYIFGLLIILSGIKLANSTR
ncbi:MAG: DMT family transporter [Gammaproteobacteria bacterium]|nr:DMT family transporter [Gammaproteobacteria bacterium]MBL6819563.1 DMT family transporter [Gammaproteobacteria bacterium]MBL6899102.1 DMT family transporter [Gammaproteobacteria bacterium]